MPLYRFYRVGDEGRVLGMLDVVECSDDEDAIEKAKEHATTCGIEVWDMARRVSIVAKAEKGASPSGLSD